MSLKTPALLSIMIFSFFTGCSKTNKSPSEFTNEYTKSLRREVKDVEISQTSELQLEVTRKGGSKITVLLNNAYDLYKTSPSDEAQIIKNYIAANIETLNATEHSLKRECIIPVIKDSAWISEIQQFAAKNGEAMPKQVTETICDGLAIVYAEDTPQSIKYFSEKELTEAGIKRTELKSLAVENLKKCLPEIKLHGSDRVYMLTAGGVYESSALLIDSIWDAGNIKVNGDIVVCVPARDMLLITGSNDREGLEKVESIAKQIINESPYRLTERLFVRKNGAFAPLKQAQP